MFGTAVNPRIKNAGLFNFSKKEINTLLPEWHRVRSFTHCFQNKILLEKALLENCIAFPFVIKPDRGLRGIDVHIIHNREEFESITLRKDNDYLVEEFISDANEIGVFIARKKNGELTITGITHKVYPSIEGDGKTPLIHLLQKHPRYKNSYLKLPEATLKRFDTIPSKGEVLSLSTIGNHNRGTMFLDGTKFYSEKAQHQLMRMFEQMEGIDYGRFDIKFPSLSDLENEGSFKIIEFNGAMAEPTHIYDPSYSYFKAVGVYVKHIQLLHESFQFRKRLGGRPLSILETYQQLKLHRKK